ncbi:DNA polymerase-1 [Seinonella peptonophila]|uniref:DNA-directed DNA polymerase n=1 Tax=Seinonella peptonophila TaxID=112248 RepID=A0A1M4VF12_9BACL|nr:DNA polymerase [Seinonella peptonophila]SHE67440.1 DNA polymerase-1 [Seinonella peptonophila]
MIGEFITDSNRFAIARKLVLDNRKVSKGTNLQNIPSRTKEGTAIRKCMVPSPGFMFLGADLSQAEPRVQAHIMYTKYGDNSLRQIFLDGKDLYTTMAMLAFDLPEKYCRDNGWYDPVSKTGGEDKNQAPATAFFPRKMMKQGVLAMSYQQTPKRFAETMNVTLEVAQLVFDRFNQSFPAFDQMVKDTIEFMKKNGYVETLFGRKRRFADYQKVVKQAEQNEPKLMKLYRERKRIKDKKRLEEIEAELTLLKKPRTRKAGMERECFNAVIQGSATSDIIKLNGIKMAQICRERGWKLVASIHDEIIIEVPKKDVTIKNMDLFSEVMTQTVPDWFTVPLKSDTVVMPRWAEEYGMDEWDFENCRPKKEK